MIKEPTCAITKVFLVFLVAITLSFGGNYEERSSYYLITEKSCISSKNFEVYNALSDVACMSLCNYKEGCSKGVYNHDSGSCLLEMANCKNQKGMKNRAGALISTGKHFFQFSKLGRTYDFKERKFREKPHGACSSPTPVSSCKDIYETDRSAASGAYSVFPDVENSSKVEVYCHMTEISGCGKGGWTLVMKIDGTKDTFRYDSLHWTSKDSFQPASALKGLDHNEALSPTYWATPMTKLCLGMEQKSEKGMALKWILVSFAHAQTLHSLIADGGHRFTSLRREDWLSLMTNSTLGHACPEQGFNPSKDALKVRIGMIAGESCQPPRRASIIGFATPGNYSCGNFKGDDLSGVKGLPSFGYILVQ